MYNTEIIDIKQDFERGVSRACELIKANELVAFPTETVYGLGANAFSKVAVEKIFKVKGRPQDNPLIVHVASIEQAKTLAHIDDEVEKILSEFWPGAFTAVLRKKDIVPDTVTAGLDTVGIRMPKNPGIIETIKRTGLPIAAPSANKSGSPSPTEAYHVEADLVGTLPLILDGGRSEFGIESTVCDLTQTTPLILRPGAVTAEQIKDFVGMVKISPHVLTPLSGADAPASPGMKYKHYAPHADVVVIKGSKDNTIAKIKALYDADKKNGETPVIFCYSEDANLFEGRSVTNQGKNQNVNDVAKNLFKNLRDIDNAGYTKVYFQAVPTSGIGLAVMNRIIRAAGFDLLLVK
jgi:L-threonylcarbamoyladenylate synthase